MEKRQPDIIKKTSIGGQALIEGIMMRGPETTAMAVRHVSGKIILEEWETAGKNKPWYMRVPFVRGIFNFIDSLRIGYKCLMRSAELSGLEEEEDKKDEKKSVSPKLMSFLMALSAVLGVAVCVAARFPVPQPLQGCPLLQPRAAARRVRGRFPHRIVCGLHRACGADEGHKARVYVSRRRAQDHFLL